MYSPLYNGWENNEQYFMRKFLYTLMAAFIAMTAISQTSDHEEPSVIIKRLTGTDLNYALAQVGKITFANDSIYLVAHNGQLLGKEAQGKTHKILFDDSSIETTTPEISGIDIRVYPNPTSDKLVVSGVESGTVIRIYANDGKLLDATTADSQTAILPVSHLAQGSYLLQINTTIVKFIKK